MKEHSIEAEAETGSERRIYPRHPLDIEITLLLAGETLGHCRVQDFCRAGMLVKLAASPVAKLVRGVEINLLLQLPGMPTGDRLTGWMVRRQNLSIGIQIKPIEQAIYQRLLAQAGPQGDGLQAALDSSYASQQPQLSRRYIERVIEQAVEGCLPDFSQQLYDGLTEALAQLAERAGSNNARTQIHEDNMQMMRLRQQFLPTLHGLLNQHREEPGPVSEEVIPEEDELALVETDAFEGWLDLSSVVSHLNEAFEDVLQRLDSQIGQVAQEQPSIDPLCCRPEMLGTVVSDLISGIGLRTESRHVCLLRSEVELESFLGPLYGDITGRLRTLGLEPLERKLAKPRVAPNKRIAPTDTTQQRTESGAPSSPPLSSTRGGRVGGIASSGQPNNEDIARLTSMLSRVIGDELGDPQELQALAFKLIERQARSRLSVKQGAQSEERIEALDDLAQTILNDPELFQSSREWIRQFKLPLLQAALERRDFFKDKEHPTRQLVNQLDHLGMYAGQDQSGLDPAEIEHLESLLERAKQMPAEDVDGLQAISRELAQIEQHRSSAFQRNVEHLVSSCEGRFLVQQADRRVEEVLQQTFGGMPVHESVRALLQAGWHALLRLTLIQQDEQSQAWQQRLQALQQLNQLLVEVPPPSATQIDPKQLMQVIEEGLRHSTPHPYQRDRVVDQLKQWIKRVQTGHFQRDPEKLETFVARTDPTGPLAGNIEQHARRMALIKGLNTGDRVAFKQQDGSWRSLYLAWIAGDLSELMFVDQRGLKAFSRDFATLSDELLRGDASALDRADKPVVERAYDAILSSRDEWLTYVTSYDPLTGLLNRRYLSTRLEQLLTSDPQINKGALLCLDIDHFTIVNDIGGYEAGDKVLVEIAVLLTQQVSEAGVFRTGVDQFVILQKDTDLDSASMLAERLCRLVSAHQFEWEGRQQTVKASIGMVPLQLKRWSGARELMTVAESTCRVAQGAGGDRVRLYSEQDSAVADRMSTVQWAGRIDEILEQDRLRLRAQRIEPLQGSHSLHPRGHYEVLLSVINADGELLSLFEFIRAAERYGRMGEVDRVVVRKAIEWLAHNRDKIDRIGGLAINLSGLSFSDQHLPDYIAGLIDQHALPAEWLCFEITETVAVSRLEDAIGLINRIRALGCSFALDDFGSGQASYSYLKDLPVDFVKIDGIFVKEILKNRSDFAVVKSINEISHFLGMETIAEYVENSDIAVLLTELGVDYAQGFGVEKPVDIETL